MIIIHGVKTLPRLVGNALAERLRVMPATVVTGARQTGKSTLAEQLVTGKRRYVSLDDLDVLDAARGGGGGGGGGATGGGGGGRPGWWVGGLGVGVEGAAPSRRAR
jgi:hypothetical protein